MILCSVGVVLHVLDILIRCIFRFICTPGVGGVCFTLCFFSPPFWNIQSFSDFVFVCIKLDVHGIASRNVLARPVWSFFFCYRLNPWMHERVAFPFSLLFCFCYVLAYIGVVIVRPVSVVVMHIWFCKRCTMWKMLWRNEWRHHQSINFPLTCCFRQ